MPFWKKTIAKKVREHLRSIDRKIKNLNHFSEKNHEVIKVLTEIKASLEIVKQEVILRYKEETIKPWIDAKYDPQLSAMAGEEIAAIEDLEKNIQEYLDLAATINDASELHSLVSLLLEEELQIQAREERNKEIIVNMELQTIASRLKGNSESPPPQKTKDGVAWKKIVTVSRELGASLECRGGKHSCNLNFPRGSRPIPLSSDVSTTALADKIREQLVYSLPKHKIPSAVSLRNALKKGDLRQAA